MEGGDEASQIGGNVEEEEFMTMLASEGAIEGRSIEDTCQKTGDIVTSMLGQVFHDFIGLSVKVAKNAFMGSHARGPLPLPRLRTMTNLTSLQF